MNRRPQARSPRASPVRTTAGASGARVGTAFIASNESGAHPLYKQAVIDAGRGDTLITDTFSTQCPLCATSTRHRVLASCVDAVRSIGEGEIGEVMYGSQPVPLSKGSPLSPSSTMTGYIEAMAMYASDAAADVTAIRPAADVLSWLCHGVADRLARTESREHSPRHNA